ncbi:MAG: motility associated factor glycosyltransferase family protein [Spirochaetes bacterium]|nr:motility associated factor glycosyltransferase family protein [Spirochaetota bacterium]
MGKYKIADTPAGLKTLIFIHSENSREIKLHSAYNPQVEAERAVESFKAGRSSLLIVTGLALGYHVDYLKQKFRNHIIIIIEKDPEVIDLVKTYNQDILKNIYVINSASDFPEIFEKIDITMIRGVSSYIHRPSYMLDQEFYNARLKDIKEYISSRVSDLLTRFEFEENWIRHIFRNVHHIYSSTPVSGLFGRFKGMPGIIVSAGPSLKKNVKLLNDIRDKALIVCVDTALKVLQNYNVVPHIVMTLDSQKYSLKHFLGLMDSKAVLMADIVSYPRLIESYKGEKILSTTSKFYNDGKGNSRRETTPVWDWMEKYTEPIGDIQSGGSVATSVFDLLLNLGCGSIILMGQDLAYTGREIHCSGTYHNDDWVPGLSRFRNLETINQNVIRKRKIKYIEAYRGREKVISDFVFDIYRFWFRESAGKVCIPVINATEGGARIENTIEKTFEEILRSIEKPSRTPDEILKSCLNKYSIVKNSKTLSDGLEEAIKELLDVQKKSQSALDNISGKRDEEIVGLISSSGIEKLIVPFLRKTFVYLARNPDLPQQKASELLISDIIASIKKLIPMLEQCRNTL